MPEQILSNTRIVLADETIDGSVRIEDGIIVDIDHGQSSLPSAQDLEGDYVIPGLVELHTDNLERHIMPRPKSFWPIDAAVLNHDREVSSAGITTVFDAMFVGDADSDARQERSLPAVTEAISQHTRSGSLKADHFIHWRCEVSANDVFTRVEDLIDHGHTGMISVMDHTPGQRQFVSIEAYSVYYQGKFGLSDDEFKHFMAERIAAQKRNSIPNRRKIVTLARERRIPIASHDDATKAHVDEAIDDGIVVAEFPTTLEAAKASHENGLSVLMGAPNVVRGQSHSGNVSARELANRNLLDILSSDYVPFSLLYGAVLLSRVCDEISLPQAIATVTKNPANKVGLNDRGELAIGKRADLVRFRDKGSVPVIVEVWKQGQRVA